MEAADEISTRGEIAKQLNPADSVKRFDCAGRYDLQRMQRLLQNSSLRQFDWRGFAA